MGNIDKKWLTANNFTKTGYTYNPSYNRYTYHTDKGSIVVEPSAVDGRKWRVEIRSHGDSCRCVPTISTL